MIQAGLVFVALICLALAFRNMYLAGKCAGRLELADAMKRTGIKPPPEFFAEWQKLIDLT